MLLGVDRGADSDGPAHDEKDAGQPGDAGTEASRRTGRGGEPALRPGHDHTKPGYAPPLPISQCRRPSLRLPQDVLLA